MLFFDKNTPIQYYKVWFIGDTSTTDTAGLERFKREYEPTGIVALRAEKECWIHMDNACVFIDWKERRDAAILFERVTEAQYETYIEFELFPVLKTSRVPFYKMLKKFRIYLIVANIIAYSILGKLLEMHFEMSVLGVLTSIMIVLFYHGLNEHERTKAKLKKLKKELLV